MPNHNFGVSFFALTIVSVSVLSESSLRYGKESRNFLTPFESYPFAGYAMSWQFYVVLRSSEP
jgi:hypothetical protein